MLYFAIICSFLIFGVLPESPKHADPRPTAIFLICILIPPLILSLIVRDHHIYFISESFHGFLSSRNDCGYASGLLILLIFLINKKYFYVALPLAIICLNLTGSRANFFAFLVSSIFLSYYYFYQYKFKNAIILVITIMMVLTPSFPKTLGFGNDIRTRQINFIDPFSQKIDNSVVYVGLFFDTSYRNQLSINSIKEILTNRPWFGKGDYYQLINQKDAKIEPHNLFLQSLLNFGIYVTLFWCLLLIQFFKKNSAEGQSLLIYMFCYGQFQPGFDAFLFIPASFIVYVLAHSFRKEKVG